MVPKVADDKDICSMKETKIEQLYCRKVELVKKRKKLIWERDAYIEWVQAEIAVKNEVIQWLNSQVHALDKQINQEQWEWVEYREDVPYVEIPWTDELGNAEAPKWANKLWQGLEETIWALIVE